MTAAENPANCPTFRLLPLHRLPCPVGCSAQQLQHRSQQVSRAARQHSSCLAVGHGQRHQGLNKEDAKPAITRCARRRGRTQCNRETESSRIHAAQAKSDGEVVSIHRCIGSSVPPEPGRSLPDVPSRLDPNTYPNSPFPSHVPHRRVGANIRGPVVPRETKDHAVQRVG